jgi:hypothetical protein
MKLIFKITLYVQIHFSVGGCLGLRVVFHSGKYGINALLFTQRNPEVCHLVNPGIEPMQS